MGRRLARLDPRLLRFHDLPADHGADLAGVRGAADRRRGRVHDYVVDAPSGRGLLGLARRSRRPPHPVDDLDPLVFALQLYCRLLAGFLVSLLVSRAVGVWDGCRMAGWCGLGNGKLADPLARVHEWDIAGFLGYRLPAVERGLRAALRLDRVARPLMAGH